jgi:hypothetical protein
MSILLPSKHVPLESSLINQSASLYTALPPASRIPRAWAICRTRFDHVTFERFTLMLDVLYALQLIGYQDETILKREGDNATQLVS